MQQNSAARQRLQIGNWFKQNDKLYQIYEWSPQNPLELRAKDIETGSVTTFALNDLFAAESGAKFAATAELLVEAEDADVVDGELLPARFLDQADRLIEIVEKIGAAVTKQQVAGASQGKTKLLQTECKRLSPPIALSTYYRYRRTYYTCQGERGQIAASLRRQTFGKTRMNADTLHYIDTILQRYYRSNPPLRIQTVYTILHQLWEKNQHWWLDRSKREAEDEVIIDHLLDARHKIEQLLSEPETNQRLVQIQLPSRAWFYQYVNILDVQAEEGKATYIARYGQSQWESNYLTFERFTKRATLPLQYVVADHYQLDVLHVDDVYREVTSRLWLTVLIDAYSRSVLGTSLAYETPNIKSIQGALRHAIWPKQLAPEQQQQGSWDCFGTPQRLSLDNAWAHHSHSLETLARLLSCGGEYPHMELMFRPPYQARYGGLVERLFGNLSGYLRERLPGAVLNPKERQWHNATQAACLLYGDIEQIILQFVLEYMHTPHRELGQLTPHEKWHQGLQLMLPMPPPLTPQLQRGFWRLYPSTRAVTHTGIALFGLHYWDASLGALRMRDKQGKRKQVHLRYDPTDISRVAVFEDGIWRGDGYAQELRLANGQFQPMSLWELQLTKAIAKKQNAGKPARPQSWLIHLQETQKLIEQRQLEQRDVRRKREQHKLEQRQTTRATTEPQRLTVDTLQLDEGEQDARRQALLTDLTEVL